jgi:hypothetical protein
MQVVRARNDRVTHFGVGVDGVFHTPPSGQVRRFNGKAELNRYLAKEFPNAPDEAAILEKIDSDFDEAA